jgi:hypothetical protein
MNIGGREFSRKEIGRWVGNLSQLGGTRHYTLDEGPAKGMRAIDVDTGSGLRFTVLPDRGLDISQASYRGINLVFITPNGEVNPMFYESRGVEWQRIFFGGLLTTCGLTYFGPPGRDGEEELGLHGRYAAIPAKRISDTSRWQGDEYLIELTGAVEEAVLFGDKVRLTRRITTSLGRKSLSIQDRVENFGYKPSPYTILYHINPGFPLLSDASYLLVSSETAQGINEHSNRHLQERLKAAPPQPDFAEQVFWYSMSGDPQNFAYAAIVNKSLAGGLGLYVRFRKDSLPCLSTWKMLGEGEYVFSLEPCNVFCENRSVLRRKGSLPFLDPGQASENEVEIGVLDGAVEITEFERMLAEISRSGR